MSFRYQSQVVHYTVQRRLAEASYLVRIINSSTFVHPRPARTPKSVADGLAGSSIVPVVFPMSRFPGSSTPLLDQSAIHRPEGNARSFGADGVSRLLSCRV